LYGDWSYT